MDRTRESTIRSMIKRQSVAVASSETFCLLGAAHGAPTAVGSYQPPAFISSPTRWLLHRSNPIAAAGPFWNPVAMARYEEALGHRRGDGRIRRGVARLGRTPGSVPGP